MRARRAICAALCAGGLSAGAAGAGELPALPSGQALRFVERVDAGEIVHFRFVAPRIARAGGDISIAEAGGDMQVLCESFALPMLEGAALPERIVIALADREVPFGEANPEATQFFEAFRIEDGACIWEGF